MGYVAPIVFGLLLTTAAATDLLSYRIPNWIVLAIAALVFLQALRHIPEVGWLNQLGAGALCLAVGMLLFGLGQLGAGDAKYLGSVALWSGFSSLLPLLFFTSLAGLALLAILVGARRFVKWRGWTGTQLPKALIVGQGVPFGIAITLGALATMPSFPRWLWQI